MGDLTLPNRIVMAPMTRNRAGDADVPVSQTVTYYAQRASAGMIITEGSQVSPQGVGYMHTPGIYSAAQVAGWKKVTDAVHQAGCMIFIQLWHVGRVSHSDFLGGALPVEGFVHTPGGKKQIQVPRALKTDEVPDIIRQFQQAAENARTAGYRISPHMTAHSMSDANPRETFSYFTRELKKIGMGYLHLIEPIGGRMGFVSPEARLGPTLRRIFERTFILNGGYGLHSGNEAIASGEADLIAFGVPFLANPDLPERFRQNAPLNEPDVATF
jgi:N-ethylmaleimide reductase